MLFRSIDINGLVFGKIVIWLHNLKYNNLTQWVVMNVRESGETSKRKSYLPPEKQYLITRNGKLITILLEFLFLLCKLFSL